MEAEKPAAAAAPAPAAETKKKAAAPAKKGAAPAASDKKAAAAAEAEAAAAAAAPALPPPEPFMGVTNRSDFAGVKDVSAAAFISALAKYFKRTAKIAPPSWADFVKTGVGKELSPYDPDWFYVRAASVARKLYIKPCGLGMLRRVYGNKTNRGSRPAGRALASGNILRKILQQLEGLKFIEKRGAAKGGRRLTPTGRRELDRIAKQVAHETKRAPISF